jgi:predicted hydrocarbon binding protein
MVHQEDAVIVNALVRQALIASEEVMGENGLNIVLKSAKLDRFIGNYPPDNLDAGIKTVEYSLLNQAIEDFYGRGGRGILKRIGKASFQYGLNEQPALMGLAGIALKALPHKQRIKFVLSSVADALKKSNPQVNAWVDEEADTIFFAEDTCGICHSRTSDKPICYLMVGSLTEAVLWATGGTYDIRETQCMAMGAECCRFEVGQRLD